MRVTIAGAGNRRGGGDQDGAQRDDQRHRSADVECFLAAARAGVVEEVAASLKNNFPGLDWKKLIPYNLERMARHGERRAAEMEEVVATLPELGVEPLMAAATVKRQREMGRIGTQHSVRNVLDKDGAAILNAVSAAARDRH